MDLAELEALVNAIGDDVDGEDGAWQFDLEGVRMACLTDTHFDRIRVIAPIVDEAEMTEEQLHAVLEANFHTALDARYATSDGILYAAFLHPLTPLTEDELRSAIDQVVSLVQTFGTTYSGGTLVFGVAGPGDGLSN